MKQLRFALLIAIAVAAFFGWTLLTGEPVAASTCEYYCQQDYEECVGAGLPESGCAYRRAQCLAQCP